MSTRDATQFVPETSLKKTIECNAITTVQSAMQLRRYGFIFTHRSSRGHFRIRGTTLTHLNKNNNT